MLRMQVLVVGVLSALLLAACGGSEGGGGGSGGGAGGGLDASGVQKHLALGLELEVGDAARISKFREIDRKMEGSGDFQSCMIRFEGEIEITADCNHQMKDRKAGERVPFEAEAEFLKEAAGWRRVTVGIHVR